MAHDVLSRLRKGLDEKKFTLTAIAREADIPLTTLDHMRKEKPSQRIEETLARLEAIKRALDKIAPESSGDHAQAEQGATP